MTAERENETKTRISGLDAAEYHDSGCRVVEKGLASADRGELLTHEEVGARLEKLIAGKQAHR